MVAQHWCKARFFFRNYLLFFKNQSTVVGRRNEENNYGEPSVKLKLLRFQQMVENGQKQAWLTKMFKSGQYLINAVYLNGNQISSLAGFQRGLP